jgi:predicted HTH transcriptional regulator
MDTLFSKNLDDIKFSDIEEFCALDSPEEQRPREGLRIDFKSPSFGNLPKFMVAFANTSGGMIVLGINENQGIPQNIIGIPLGKTDIKTRITEIAYSAINPPPYS